ncbi:MAG: tetratricopeptide repeat protein [Nitrospirae bacterium]|nr:tetratricopeptide repeat protein [Nitrospirota bacterium]
MTKGNRAKEPEDHDVSKQGRAASRITKFLWAAPVFLALLVNFNVLQNGYGWDDETIIQKLRLSEHWWSLLLPNPGVGPVSKQDLPYFRPVADLSYLLDYQLWGNRPFGFHLSVFLAHLLNTALVFFLARELAGSFNRAAPNMLPLMAASLFAVHPIHAEAVAWIAGRNDVFCTTFLLSSLLLYLRFHRTGNRIVYGLSMFCFVLALLTKEAAIGMIVLFPLYDYLIARRPVRGSNSFLFWRPIALRMTVPLVITGLYFWTRSVKITRPYGDATPSTFLLFQTFWKMICGFGFYVKLMVFPYPHRPFIAALPSSFPFFMLSGLIAVLILGGIIFALVRREILVGIGLVWTAVILAPAVSLAVLLVASTTAAERYVYGPSAGFLIVVAWLMVNASDRLPAMTGWPPRTVWIVTTLLWGGLTAAWGWESGHRNAVWRNPVTFWEAAAAPSPEAGFPLRELGLRYAQLKKEAEAEQLYRRAIALDEKNLGPEHPEVGADLHNLGSLYHDRGRYAEAEPLYQQALAIWEKALGPGSPDVATALNNLAALYFAQGKYAQAEPFFKRALAIWEKAFGPDNLDLVQSLNNLAEVDRALNRPAEAEPLYRRAIALQEKALGPNHPDLVQNLNNLAELYRNLNRPAEAAPLFQRALAIREKTLRPNDPVLAASFQNLASLDYDLGRYAEAEPLYQQALALREKALGPEHSDVAAVLNQLAALYYAEHKYTQAEPLYRRALAIQEKTGGPENLEVVQSLNNLGVLYNVLGRYAEAEPLYKRSLAIRKKVLGPTHPDVATGLNNLAGLYYAQGRYAEAESLFREALSIREKTLRPTHPDLATSLENYAALLRKIHRESEAAQMAARARVIRGKTAP